MPYYTIFMHVSSNIFQKMYKIYPIFLSTENPEPKITLLLKENLFSPVAKIF